MAGTGETRGGGRSSSWPTRRATRTATQPCFAAPDGSLWLFWPTILDHRWEGALLKYARSDRPGDDPGPPRWSRTGVLHVTPQGFADEMKRAIASLNASEKERYRSELEEVEHRSADELYQRLGWMPRVHPVVLPSGSLDSAALFRHVLGLDHGDLGRPRRDLDRQPPA